MTPRPDPSICREGVQSMAGGFAVGVVATMLVILVMAALVLAAERASAGERFTE